MFINNIKRFTKIGKIIIAIAIINSFLTIKAIKGETDKETDTHLYNFFNSPKMQEFVRTPCNDSKKINTLVKECIQLACFFNMKMLQEAVNKYNRDIENNYNKNNENTYNRVIDKGKNKNKKMDTLDIKTLINNNYIDQIIKPNTSCEYHGEELLGPGEIYCNFHGSLTHPKMLK